MVGDEGKEEVSLFCSNGKKILLVKNEKKYQSGGLVRTNMLCDNLDRQEMKYIYQKYIGKQRPRKVKYILNTLCKNNKAHRH